MSKLLYQIEELYQFYKPLNQEELSYHNWGDRNFLVKLPVFTIFGKIALSQKFYMLLIKIFLQKCCARYALTNSSKKPRQKSFFPWRIVIFSKKSCFGHVHLPDHFYKVFHCLQAKISPGSESSDTILGMYVKISTKIFFHSGHFFCTLSKGHVTVPISNGYLFWILSHAS